MRATLEFFLHPELGPNKNLKHLGRPTQPNKPSKRHNSLLTGPQLTHRRLCPVYEVCISAVRINLVARYCIGWKRSQFQMQDGGSERYGLTIK